MKRQDWSNWLVIALCLFICAKLRVSLAERFHKLKVTSDFYALPSPEQVVALSFGYRAALADLIWGNVLVSYGLHFQEKRNFEFIGSYLDTINALDPKFESPYRFADTLLTLQPVGSPPLENYEKAREILLRGMRELPYSAELHSSGGQFLAYLGPNNLKDDKQKAQWRMDGAQAMARACELADASSNIPYHCIVAAGILNRAGDKAATIQMLNKILAVNDDPEIQSKARAQLALLKGDFEKEVAIAPRRNELFAKAWKADLGYLRKDAMLVVGPQVNTANCAGLTAVERSDCAVTWREWFARKLPVSTD
jgi:tetratricopeptide (TPR) repeat protein